MTSAVALQHSAVAEPETVALVVEPRLRELHLSELTEPGLLANWEALAERASEPNPFYESWYLLPSLLSLDPEQVVRVLVLESEAGWLGLMPIKSDRWYYRYPLPQLCSWLHGNCFLGLPLIAAGHEKPFWQALLKWADANAGSGLFLHLSQLPLETEPCRALQAVLTEQGRKAAIVHREERAMLASDLSPDDYLAGTLSGKKRKELGRQLTRLSEQGEVVFEQCDDKTGLEAWIEHFLTLEAGGWKGKAGSALASSPDTDALFRKALAGAAQRSKLQRQSLLLDGRPIAMLATFLTPPGSFSFKTAFDQSYSRFSPGVLLQCRNLALLEQPGIAWSDSCAAADHPMIDHIWRERREMVRMSIAVGGMAKRNVFGALLRLETGGTAKEKSA